MCDINRCKRLSQRATYWRKQRGGKETAEIIERVLAKECPHKEDKTNVNKRLVQCCEVG